MVLQSPKWSFLVMTMMLTAASGTSAQNVFGSTDNANSVVVFDNIDGTLLGDFVSAGDGGLNSSQGLALGPDGNIYVASTQSDAILRFNGSTGAFIDDFVAASGAMVGPMGLVFGPDGNLYVTSRFTNEVLAFDGTTGALLIDFVEAGDGGLLTPEALTFDSSGDLYVASANTNEVLRYDGGTGTFLGAFVSAGDGGLDYPHGLAFDQAGHLFVSSHFTDSVLEYDTDGSFLGDAVAPGAGGLSGPVGLTFLPAGELLVASIGSSTILRVDTGGATSIFASGSRISSLSFIDRPALQALDLSSTNVPGGCSVVTATVTLSKPAQAGGVSVEMSSLNPLATVPATIFVNPGEVTGVGSITTATTSTTEFGQIRAKFGGVTRNVTLTVRPIRISTFSVSPSTVPGNTTATGDFSIECLAPAGGVSVGFTSSDTALAQVPASAAVPPGALNGSVSIAAGSPGTNQTVVITASAGGTSLARTITVTPPANLTLVAVAVSPSLVIGSRTATGTVTIGAPAGTGGVTISLTLSIGQSASLPSSTVVIPPGATSATFVIETTAVRNNVLETVNARFGNQLRSRSFSILPITPKLVQIQPSTTVGGTSVTAKITLQEPAAPDDITITMSTSNAGVAIPSEATFVIPAGQKVGTTVVNTLPVGSNTTVSISASARGTTRSANLTVTP